MTRRKRMVVKIVVLGDSGVGKSSLLDQYVNEKFYAGFRATIGADLLTKNIIVDDIDVVMQIWDTAGQERFQSLGVAFYHGATACVLCYDVTNPRTFENLESWREEFLIQSGPKDCASFPFLVVGNKADKGSSCVSTARVKAWCDSTEGVFAHIETSAKEATNVAIAFREIGSMAVAREKRMSPVSDETYICPVVLLADSDGDMRQKHNSICCS